MPQSIYTDVVVWMKKDGELVPLFIVWENGVKYKITRFKKMGQRCSAGGGNGILYVVTVEGAVKHLFYDRFRNAWFLEK